MREKLGGVLFVWFLSYESCLGRFVVEKNSLKVISPDSLKNVYDSAIGYFGVPDQYGGTLTGAVIYPKANKRACMPFTDVDISIKAGDCPIIILADRGGCYLTLKMWNAQNAGAAVILIADDRFEPLIVMDTPEEVNPRADYFPNITIPSAIVSKALGDSMKKALANSEMVNLNLRLDSFSNDGRTTMMRCRPKRDSKIEFVKIFKCAAQILEQKMSDISVRF